MPKGAHYDQEDVLVRYEVQHGLCACGASLFPNYHVRLVVPGIEHPCNLILLCDFCGDPREEPDVYSDVGEDEDEWRYSDIGEEP